MAQIDVSVKVVLHPPGHADGDYHFETVDLPMGWTNGRPNNVLYFRNCKKNDKFRIFYKLDNSARPGFLFPTASGAGDQHLLDALWVQEASSCPTQPCTWDQFKATGVEDGGLTLVVENLNEKRANFAYSLRVTDSSSWLLLDPGGTNENRGEPLIRNYLAIGAVTGGVVGLGSAMLANNMLEPSGALVFAVIGAVVGLIIGFVLGRL